MALDRTFWKGKRVLVTGHTGFKGSWLCTLLFELGAEVSGYALDPYTSRDNYVLCGLKDKMTDIRGSILDHRRLRDVFAKCAPEIVFHLAAQPLVRLSYREPRLTYETNVMGTLHVLEAIRSTSSVRCGVMITTDKCYENRDTLQGYKENDPMGGHDPYSSSKGCAELLIASYRRSFFHASGSAGIASARAGNVIGGGDWAADRLVPDCIRAIEAGEPVTLRNPNAVRPWQFVLEPLSGYLTLAENLFARPAEYGEGWNFGPEMDQIATVGEVAERIVEIYGEGSVKKACDTKGPYEAKLLTLDITKAKERLGWRPKLSLEETLKWTAEWYRDYRKGNPWEICREQTGRYIQALHERLS